MVNVVGKMSEVTYCQDTSYTLCSHIESALESSRYSSLSPNLIILKMASEARKRPKPESTE